MPRRRDRHCGSCHADSGADLVRTFAPRKVEVRDSNSNCARAARRNKLTPEERRRAARRAAKKQMEKAYVDLMLTAGAPADDITDEMVAAAAEVLWRDPFAGISEFVAQQMTRKMLALALSARRGKIAAADHGDV